MKKIEKRLKEYRIRFRDTERIEKKAYPFEEWEMSTDLEEESFEPSIDEEQIINHYGKVYEKGEWAIADIKTKPVAWVVEKNTAYKAWDEFKEYYRDKFTCDDFNNWTYFVVNNLGGWVSNDITEFGGCQMLTPSQWADFFLPKNPKIDLSNGSILYEEGRIMIMKGDGNKYHTLYNTRIGSLYFDRVYYGTLGRLAFNSRPATEEEKQILFDALARKGLKWNPDTLQIEEISKVGDWGVFYDRKENLKDRLRNNSVGRIGVLGRIRRDAREYIFREFDGLGWKCFHKIDPSKSLLEIVEQLKKDFNIK